VSPATHVPLKSTETPAVKKKHRRSRSGARSHDVIADAGNKQFILYFHHHAHSSTTTWGTNF